MEKREIERREMTPAQNGPPTPPAGESVPEQIAAQPTFSQWLASNAFSLIVVAAALIYVLLNFDAEGIWAIAKALIGLSFVIFIHELGHFLAAKWCDVHVTTFSIGFGPPVPGCWFKWGETVYKLALFPLGGYVQMVGQVDGDEASDGSEDDPRSYRNKSVGQRMLIISAGVIMNVLLAIVCFIIVYQGQGKDRTAAVISTVEARGPAFRQGVRPGMEVLQIGDIKNPNFEDLMAAVVFTDAGDKVRFVAQRPGETPIDIMLEPLLESGDTRPVIGVGPASRLELATRRLVRQRPVVYGSPAAKAEPPFEFGDLIIGTSDPQEPSKVIPLPDDPRTDQSPQKDYFEFYRRMALLAGQKAIVQVKREDGTVVSITVPPAFHRSLGIRMRMGQIVAVRADSPAAEAGIQPADRVNKREGDVITKVVLPEPGGKEPTVYDESTLDPERLPHQLQQWADRLDRADAKSPKKVTLHLRRHRAEGGEQFQKEVIELDYDSEARFDRVVSLQLPSPLAIPELGLAYYVRPIVAGVYEGQIENNPLQPGDVIKEIQVTSWLDDEQTRAENNIVLEGNWAYLSYYLYDRPAPVKQVTLKIQRDKETFTVDVTPVEDRDWPLVERGWVLMSDERRQKASNMVEAIELGLRDTHRQLMRVVQTVRGMVLGRISPKELGGPITIARTAYTIAGYDFWEFIFFMGFISINLAVINFLPIPVLDGGHMVFLLYEKVRGKPASENVRVGATYVGLALILSLMVFVFWLDLRRF